jgi:hypothetical protein
VNKNFLDGVLMEMMLSLAQYGLWLQPNGTFFIQLRQAGLGVEFGANHFLQAWDMKNGM